MMKVQMSKLPKWKTPIHQVGKSKLIFPKHKRHQMNNLTSKTTNSWRSTGHMKSLHAQIQQSGGGNV